MKALLITVAILGVVIIAFIVIRKKTQTAVTTAPGGSAGGGSTTDKICGAAATIAGGAAGGAKGAAVAGSVAPTVCGVAEKAVKFVAKETVALAKDVGKGAEIVGKDVAKGTVAAAKAVGGAVSTGAKDVAAGINTGAKALASGAKTIEGGLSSAGSAIVSVFGGGASDQAGVGPFKGTHASVQKQLDDFVKGGGVLTDSEIKQIKGDKGWKGTYLHVPVGAPKVSQTTGIVTSTSSVKPTPVATPTKAVASVLGALSRGLVLKK